MSMGAGANDRLAHLKVVFDLNAKVSSDGKIGACSGSGLASQSGVALRLPPHSTRSGLVSRR